MKNHKHDQQVYVFNCTVIDLTFEQSLFNVDEDAESVQTVLILSNHEIINF